MSRDDYSAIEIPFPPKKEQSRIVSKIEELFSDLDASVAALERARANLKRYRASVLKAAVEGRLTAEWRKNHPATEPAGRLLERILAERRSKWEQAQLARFAAAGKAPPKNWKDKYAEPAKPDTESLAELPEGWCWATLQQACDEIVDCEHSTAKFAPKGIACVDTTCIRPRHIVMGDLRYVDEETYKFRIRRLEPQEGDLIFAREGTVGTVALVPAEFRCCLGQRVMLFRPDKSALGKWMELAIDSELFRAQYRSKILGTTSPHLNVGDIKMLAIPLAPIGEQQAIIDSVSATFSKIDASEISVGLGTTRASRLRQSILKRAFEGRLVPQDPNDEPASVLLERIRAARAKPGAAPAKGTGRRGWNRAAAGG